ncbi:hypothetical protein [Vibrio phage RYC]|nr:hypothetical protein [Vibrio phage RYC]
MPDFATDEFGDLKIDGGLSFVEGSQEKAQRLNLAISINLGEFFAAVNYGLPWIENQEEEVAPTIRYFLGDRLQDQSAYVATQLDNYLRRIDFVDELQSSYAFDDNTREFTYNFTVVTNDGDIINFPPYITEL